MSGVLNNAQGFAAKRSILSDGYSYTALADFISPYDEPQPFVHSLRNPQAHKTGTWAKRRIPCNITVT